MDEHSIAAVVASVEASLPKEYKNASVIMNWKKKTRLRVSSKYQLNTVLEATVVIDSIKN